MKFTSVLVVMYEITVILFLLIVIGTCLMGLEALSMYGSSSARYKLYYSWDDSSWVCVLKRKGIRVEGRGLWPRMAIWKANREMRKAIKLKKQFETFKSQVCE